MKRSEATYPLTLLVEQYWIGVLQRLQAEVDVFARLGSHAGEMRRENELATIPVSG